MIQIDYREHELIKLINNLIQNTPITCNVLNLDIGDIVLNNRIIIERKTISDLNSSILDGRYEEQSYRLSNSLHYHRHHIIYLIEGTLHSIKYDESQKTRILSAIFSLQFYKGFSVMRTFSIDDTAAYIVHCAKKMLKHPDKPGYFEITTSSEVSNMVCNIKQTDIPIATDNPPLETTNDLVIDQSTPADTTTQNQQILLDKQYIPLVKSTKKLNITENNIDEIMLCQVPGISSQTAQAIISHFGSFQNMILQYSVNGENILSDIRVSRKNSNSCKLNKTVIANIIKYVFKPVKI
jgi:ERCC4-type nuclease